MSRPATSAKDMVSGMSPRLQPGEFVFVTVPPDDTRTELAETAIASFQELEGLSLILPFGAAQEQGFDASLRMRCITLTVHSSLEGVGLTAAVSSALASHDIPCNMVAAFHHDHVFVPSEQSDDALQILMTLQSSG